VLEHRELLCPLDNSGYTNNYITMRWLEDCSEPSTRERAEGSRRLLILDGHESHVQVEFLEACWRSNIMCVVLPAHLSGIFQPQDVGFFNLLKLAYHRHVDDYQLGLTASRATKPMLYQWHQRAWLEAASSQHIRSAWARAGLFPLSQGAMRALTITPERQHAHSNPETPHNSQSIQAINRKVRRGEISPTKAFSKTQKALEKALAEKVLLEKDMERRDAAEAVERAARASKERTRFPQGHLFDLDYQGQHAAELAERKQAEERARQQERRWRAKGKDTAESSNYAQERTLSPAISVSSREIIVCMRD